MKTNFVKQIIPVAAFALATVGAFTTHAMNQRTRTIAPQQGFLKLNPAGTSCEQKDLCSTINSGNLCTVGLSPTGAQIFGKNGANACIVTVYRP